MIFLTTISAPGVLNHSVALAKLLRAGSLEVLLLVGPEAEDHLKFIKCDVPWVVVESLRLDFDRSNPNRKPHIQQILSREYLVQSTREICALAEKHGPRLLITKNIFSPVLVSQLIDVPYATYHTGGDIYLLKDKSPLLLSCDQAMGREFHAAADELGIDQSKLLDFPHCITGGALNIVRGLGEISGLAPDERKGGASRTVFVGTLVFDGAKKDETFENPFKNNNPIVYVTFGTVCYDMERYRIILGYFAKNKGLNVVVSSFNLDLSVLGIESDNIFVSKYIPNSLVMKQAQLVVHHGGFGTFLESFEFGVPMLIIPDNLDRTCQLHHGNTARKLDVGMVLDRADLTEGSFGECLGRLLDGDHKKRAVGISERIQTLSRNAQDELIRQVGRVIDRVPR